MTVSKPSHEIYAVDVPEVVDFAATFRYNFFVPDESVNDTGGVPEIILLRNSSQVDADFLQFSLTRAPRLVAFQFTPPKLADVGNEVSDVDIRNNTQPDPDVSGLISDNLDKIVTEDQFASYNFVSVHFHDSDIDTKVFFLVSSSFEQHTLGEEVDHNISHAKVADRMSTLFSEGSVSPHFLKTSLSQFKTATGTQFHTSDSVVGNTAGSAKSKAIKGLTLLSGRNETSKLNKYFQRLKSFNIHAQINGKLFHDVVNRSIDDPQSPFSDDLHSIYQFSKQVTSTNKQAFTLELQENDYKTFVPFVDLRIQSTAHQINRRAAEIVGYLIDKTEITRDGTTQQHPPLVIEGARLSSTADYRIRYDSTYAYTIRTIAKFTLPAIDNETGDIATVQILVSSRPSAKVYIKATEKVPPPPPAELDFTWNYETEKLLVHWSFPTNSQQDIKKFQVFRRKNVEHPFELIKMYDFDDSVVRYEDAENPDPSLIEFLKSPATFYIDDDFNKQSRFIYSVASLDAHGMTSNLSAQFELWFDPFKNKLQKKLVSHSGAPKPYPNLYLEEEMFVDTIRVSGPHSKRLKVYFNPEFYYLYDDEERLMKVLATKQLQGEYKLQLLNVDSQRSQTLSISIDDRIKPTLQQIVFPKLTFGEPKRAKKRRS